MKNRAFSIIELVIILAVIGIIAAVLIPLMSSIITNANTKSALSDAKNTLTNYIAYCESNQKSKSDISIIVEKAKSFYVFGYFESINELIASKNNPYKAQSLEQAVIMLIDSDAIIMLGMNSADITANLPDMLDNVVVYEDCKLQSIGDIITLDKKQLGLCVNESCTLIPTTFPKTQNLLTWESKDESVASVNNGEVTGISQGETEVIAHYGDVSEVCKVTVGEFLEFSGNMAELKTLIENDRNAVFIRLMNNVELEDYPNIFPILIPENKVIRIDFNHKSISYTYSDADNSIYSMFVNDGGDFYFESSSAHRDGSLDIYGYNFEEGDGEGDTAVHLIENRNNGNLIISDVICLSNIMNRNADSYAICNTSGTVMYLNGQCSSSNTAIFNNRNGKLFLEVKHSILSLNIAVINHGVIEDISNTRITGMVNIRNYGLIKGISDCEFRAKDTAIENIGTNAIIESINSGIFGLNAPEFYLDNINAIVLKDGSTIGSIKGGTFYGTNSIVCDESSDITYGISGGKFATQVPSRLLAKGKHCHYNEEIKMYVVE